MQNRLRALRKEIGLTAQGASDKLKNAGFNISPDLLVKYERGDREPQIKTWENLALFYHVSVPYLQGFMPAGDGNQLTPRYLIETDNGTYYDADSLTFKNMGGQWFLDGFSKVGCRAFINTAKIVGIEEMYKDKGKC